MSEETDYNAYLSQKQINELVEYLQSQEAKDLAADQSEINKMLKELQDDNDLHSQNDVSQDDISSVLDI